MGLRKLLTRQPAEDPLERLAELGRKVGATHPSRPFADATTQSEAAPKRGPSVDERVERSFVAESKERVEPSRSRSGYVWVSQASRSKRASWADMPERF
jgi:hypothetical protein